MLNKMSILLAATAAVALSAGAAFADPYDHHDNNSGVAVTVGDPGQTGYGNGYNYGYDDGAARRDRDAHYRAETWRAQGGSGALISVNLGGIAFGYRDGYWDNGHRWHRWNDNHAYQAYRDQSGSNFHDYNHDRDSNMGWQR